MSRSNPAPAKAPSWRIYSARDGRKIERAMRDGHDPLCPVCGERLQSESSSRLSPRLILDATSYDVACAVCRRFWCMVQETQRSLQLIRMRRLVAAVNGQEPPRRARPASVTDFIAVMHP